MKIFLIVTFLIIFVFSKKNVIVETTNGALKGYISRDVHYFLGIPYAKPPIHDLRFKRPQKVSNWTGILDATEFKNACVQPVQRSNVNLSENCLYLNIYTPSKGKNFPVMIWIHGGSFTTGSGDWYEGDSLVRNENLIVVTLNYRLGALGFLYHNELSKEDVSGLFGVLDQKMAIEWVHKNIKFFGGNENEITLFGESAGGTSVIFQLTTPSQKLFQRAIIQSGPLSFYTMNEAELVSNQFVKNLKCEGDIIECLRKKSTQEIIDAQNNLKPMTLPNIPLFRPVLDVNEFPRDYLSAFKNGRFHNVPILLGTTKDEMNYFLCNQIYQNMTSNEFNDYINREFGETSREIFKKYPLRNYPSPKEALNNILSDYLFKCPSKYIANAVSKFVPVYMYSFEYFSGFSNECLGVAHVHELPYLFPSILNYYFNRYQLSQKELEYSKLIQKSWGNFVRGSLNFDKYDPLRSNYIELKEIFTRKEKFKQEFC